LIVTSTALIGVSLLSANEIYWRIGLSHNNQLPVMVAFLVSRGMTFAVAVFLLVSLRKTLRTRWLTIEELMTYVAGAGIAMTLPLGVREVKYRYLHSIHSEYQVS
jgi:hypothetical protein